MHFMSSDEYVHVNIFTIIQILNTPLGGKYIFASKSSIE